MASLTLPVDEAPGSVPAAQNVAGWRRGLAIFVLLTGGIKSTLAFTTIVPGLQQIALEFSSATDPTSAAQRLLVLAPIGMALAGLLGGLLVRPTHLRGTMFVALGVSAVAGLAQLVITDYTLLLISRFILGFSAVTADVAMTSVLAVYFTGSSRSRLIGFRQAISSAGTVLTFLLAGYLMKHYGWRAASWMFILPGVLLVLALAAFNKPISVDRDDERGIGQLFRRLGSVLGFVGPILILSVIMAVGHAMPHTQMPFLLKDNGITDEQLISYVSSLSSFISVLSALAFGFVYPKLKVWTLALGAVLMGAGFVAAGLVSSYELILACVVVEGVGAGWTMPFFTMRVLDKVDGSQRSFAVGVVLASIFIGQFLNPVVTAPVRNAVGLHSTFVYVGLFLFMVAAFVGLWAIKAARVEKAAQPAAAPAA